MRTIRPILLPLALLLLVAPAAVLAQQGAQDQPRGEFGEEVEVSEVLLDVLVTDDQGNVIVGLGPDDFVVEEDGEEREVTSVSFYANSRVSAPVDQALEGRTEIERLPEDRYFVLFFEDQRQRQFDTDVPLLRQQLDAARFAKQWVQEDLLPGDWVAVVSYESRLKVQTDFTRDREQIVRAIDQAMEGKSLELTDEYRVSQASRTGERGGPSLIDELPVGQSLRKESLRIYDAVGLVAESVGDIRARKSLVMFSTGFGLLTTTDREDVRYYDPMVQALNDNNVAAYMVDLTPNTTTHAMSDAMNQLADDTGGRYFFNFTNFRTPLNQLAEENDGYYLLSYRSPHERGETGYQKITVRTTNPEFEVKTREGYVYGDEDPLRVDMDSGGSRVR